MSVLAAALQHHVSETTAHGLGRVGGNRPLSLRLFWAASFVGMCCLCCFSLHNAIARLKRAEHSTAIYAESAPFEFPDVYVCGLNPFGASFALNLTQQQANALKSEMGSISAKLQQLPQSSEFLKRLINSMSYSQLVGWMGHRHYQLICYRKIIGDNAAVDTFGGNNQNTSTLSEFFHPKFGRCARMHLPQRTRNILQQPNNAMTVVLISDAYTTNFPKSNHTVQLEIDNITVYPTHWDFENGWNTFTENGVRLFIVEPGTYPSDWSTSVLIKPGTGNDVRITMQQIDYDEEQFADECVSRAQQKRVQYHNPYSPDEPYSYSYSYAYCYYDKLAEIMQSQLNCTPWLRPKPAKFRWLQSCDNITGLTVAEFQKRIELRNNLTGTIRQEALISSVSKLCSTKRECSRKTYSVKQSSVTWPEEPNIHDFVRMTHKYIYPDIQQPSPMFDLGYSYAFFSNGSPRPSIDVAREIRRQIMQVRLYSDSQYSTRISIYIGYTFWSFVAEVGGYLGLYLGCSVLTLAEVLELLHSLIAAAVCKGDVSNEDEEKIVHGTKIEPFQTELDGKKGSLEVVEM